VDASYEVESGVQEKSVVLDVVGVVDAAGVVGVADDLGGLAEQVERVV